MQSAENVKWVLYKMLRLLLLISCVSALTLEWHESGSKEVGPSLFGISAQGCSNDDQFMFWSGRSRLHKTTISDQMDWKSVLVNEDPLPSSLKDEGFWHIGDCDYYGGTHLLVAAVERHNYTNAGFMFFFAGNLTFSHALITQQRHAPWVATDPETGLVYSSEFDNVTSISIYNHTFGGLVDKLVLHNVPQNGLMAVQGGVIRNGTLYLSSSSKGQPTALIDIKTGILMSSFNTATGHENEGLTIDPAGFMYQVTNGFLGGLLTKIYQFSETQ